jgi:hypothetical protein
MYREPADPSQSAEVNGDDGHQWKQLFLPEGTRLRASFKRQTDYAVVSGAQIRCGEHTVSPSGFANLRGSGNLRKHASRAQSQPRQSVKARANTANTNKANATAMK